MGLNNWNSVQVNRAIQTWGDQTPPYLIYMYESAISGGNSWLDLGCGFGRFLNYLTLKIEDPSYIGYDSSPSMIEAIRLNFPHFTPQTVLRNITLPIIHSQQVILCAAVLIHLSLNEQDRVLNNIMLNQPLTVVFDINNPIKDITYERIIKLSGGQFRMTWQSKTKMIQKLNKLFPNYTISHKEFPLNNDRQKVTFILTKDI